MLLLHHRAVRRHSWWKFSTQCDHSTGWAGLFARKTTYKTNRWVVFNLNNIFCLALKVSVCVCFAINTTKMFPNQSITFNNLSLVCFIAVKGREITKDYRKTTTPPRFRNKARNTFSEEVNEGQHAAGNLHTTWCRQLWVQYTPALTHEVLRQMIKLFTGQFCYVALHCRKQFK